MTFCRDNDKSKMEDLMLVCLRDGDSVTLEKVAVKMLDRRKLIDWKVSSNGRTNRLEGEF